jgi:hypothetical protein
MAGVMHWHCDMNAEIEEIRRQLHELRNYLGPVELLLANMEVQIKKSRVELERRITELELRLEAHIKQTDSRDAQSPAALACSARLAADAKPPASSV